MSKELNTKIETITPALAEEYLKCNTHNRTLRAAHVTRLREEIRAGRWVTTHQGIAFDEYGKLIDGQHRLHAIKLGNTPVRMLVTRGIASLVDGKGIYSNDVIDCGRGRSVGDQLNLMHGVGNANLTAASLRMVASACTGNSNLTSPTVGQAVAILSIYGDAMQDLINCSQRSKIARNAAIFGALALGYKLDAATAREFINGLVSGENIKRGDPVYALREALISRPAHRTMPERYKLMLSTANAFYNTMKGNEITLAKTGTNGIDWMLSKQRKNVETVCAILGRKIEEK